MRIQNKGNINTTDYWSSQYNSNPDRCNEHDLVKDIFFANYIQDGKSVLDIGCGNGMFLSHIFPKCPDSEIWGVDLAPSAIAQCMGSFPRGKFVAGSIFEMKLNRKFDVVVCMETLEHLEHPEEMAEKIAELTNEICIVTTPYKDHIPSAEHIQEFDDDEVHDMFRMYFKKTWTFLMASGRYVKSGNGSIIYPSGNMDTIVVIGSKI